MNIDFAKLAEAIKDKVGRKQIIAMTTIICLTWIALEAKDAMSKSTLYAMGIIALTGFFGFGIQAAIDWKNPRQSAEKTEDNP